MAKKKHIKGREVFLFLKIDGAWMPISCEVSHGLDEETEMFGTTTRDNKGWRSYLPMVQGYTISFNGQTVDEEEDSYMSYFKLQKLKRDRVLLEWKREFLNGKFMDAGTAYITNIGDSTPADGIVSFSMTLTGVGKPINELDLVKHNSGDGDLVIYTDGENFVKFD